MVILEPPETEAPAAAATVVSAAPVVSAAVPPLSGGSQASGEGAILENFCHALGWFRKMIYLGSF